MSKGRRRRKKAKKKSRAGQGSTARNQEPFFGRPIIPPPAPRPSFLKLPPEIRIQIYSYTIRPETGPFSDFDGLYKSCRLIKKETDYECAKALHDYLTKVKRKTLDDSELRFHMPLSFKALRNLRISLSTGLFHTRNKLRLSDEGLLDHLKPIFELHLDTVVITYHEDEIGYKFGMMHIRWLTRTILNKALMNHPCFINTRKVVFDLPVMNKECAEAWLNAFCHAGLRPNTWSPIYRHRDWGPAKLVMRRGRRPVAIYAKAGSRGVYKEARRDVWEKALQGKRFWLEQVYAGIAVIVIVYFSLLCVVEKAHKKKG